MRGHRACRQIVHRAIFHTEIEGVFYIPVKKAQVGLRAERDCVHSTYKKNPTEYLINTDGAACADRRVG